MTKSALQFNPKIDAFQQRMQDEIRLLVTPETQEHEFSDVLFDNWSWHVVLLFLEDHDGPCGVSPCHMMKDPDGPDTFYLFDMEDPRFAEGCLKKYGKYCRFHSSQESIKKRQSL
jgi:hypothetical protein